ncbi:MAG TPA: hypothetical protein DCS92_08095 [Gammaproteobacteria bacterium]|nr:hypothetical protein [Gammaproteobacteria bacterium]
MLVAFKSRPRAATGMSKTERTEFNHYQHNAPEYTEDILWHRVYGVIGGIVLIIALLGLGAYSLFSSGNPEPTFNVETLAASGAIPAAEDSSTAASPQAAPVTKPVTKEAQANAPLLSSERGHAQQVEDQPVDETQTQTQAILATEPAPAQTQSQTQTTQADDGTATPASHEVHITILNDDLSAAILTDAMDGLAPKRQLSHTDELGEGFIKLYFYTDLQGRAGDTLTYSWYRNDKRVAEVRIPVGSDRWRSHASKNISARMRGNWKVVVTDLRGNRLAESEFYLPTPAS